VGGWRGRAPATQTRPQLFWCTALLACNACIVLLLALHCLSTGMFVAFLFGSSRLTHGPPPAATAVQSC
jgi:hypothetical protein